MKINDHFSGHAALYANARPDYPERLFDILAAMAPGRERAWDCGTGNGQAAGSLSRYFETVCATDASTRQIAQAEPFDRVSYHVATAEHSAIASSSVDLAVVAQALHWFDLPAFVAEVRRVLRNDGVLAAWCYQWMRVGPELDEVIAHFRSHTVGPYWPAERRHVDSGYRTLDLPLKERALPALFIEKAWDLEMVMQYLGSWSATRRYIEAQGADPVAAIAGDLRRAWGTAKKRRVRWPLAVRAGTLV